MNRSWKMIISRYSFTVLCIISRSTDRFDESEGNSELFFIANLFRWPFFRCAWGKKVRKIARDRYKKKLE